MCFAIRLMIGIILGLCVSALSGTTIYRWPEVTPLQKHFHFANAHEANADVYIHGLDGKPLYLLKCRTGEYEGDPDFNYSGDFQCRLISLYEDALSTSMTENPFATTDHETRARVFAEELWGQCGDYPEYGRVRHFRLLGMKLTFKFSEVIFDRKQGRSSRAGDEGVSLRSFGFDVQVNPDKDALSVIAEPVPFAEPLFRSKENPNELYRKCDTLVPAHVPGVISEEYIRSAGLGPPYPQIVPIEKTTTIRGKPSPVHFRFPDEPIPPEARAVYLPILDANGKTAYELECSAYNVPIGEGRIDRYGIVCGLFATGERVNLLGDSLDRYSRMSNAQILADQLYGKCADYPQWGATREFRLRGFQLTMQFRNARFTEGEFADHALKQVDLNIKVERDPTATAPVALPSKYVYWGFLDRPNACEKVFVNPRLEE